MDKDLPFRRAVSSALLLSAFIFLPSTHAPAANLDDLYGPVVPVDRYLYEAGFSSYHMNENGLHGSASFSKFESDPRLLKLFHALRFSPISNLEINAGYGQYLPAEYTRFTLDGPTEVMDTVQDYTLNHFQDYSLELRLRKGPYEPYVRVRANRQKAKTDAVLLLDDTVSYDDINSHYEDFKLGIRYLSNGASAPERGDYFQVTQPLLEHGQANLEAGLGYRSGRMENTSDILLNSVLYIREYYHQLRPHFIPEIVLRYGLNDRVEVETGFSYTTPFKYRYDYKQFNPATSNFINATYSIHNDIKAPFKVSWRPMDSVAVNLSSDFRYIRQRLDVWEKETNNSITNYNPRNLHALNTKPTLEFMYFHDAGKETSRDAFSSLTKQMLKQKQALLSFRYRKDITRLKKDEDNRTLNVIDPYGNFLYPLDLFFSGTDAATFFLGNKTAITADVQPQNYYDARLDLTYGLRDDLNVGAGVGYRSGSSLHHFTAQDLIDRLYRFEPFHYFTFLLDWKIRDSSMLSLKASYVPKYKTFLDTSTHPKQFETETQYYTISLEWKILF